MAGRNMGFSDEAWALFEDDAQVAMSAVEESLLALETEPANLEQLNSLFRGLHTLKGSAGFLGLTALSRLAHVAEDLVGLARDGKQPLNDDTIDALPAALDLLRIIVSESREGPVDEHLQLIEPISRRIGMLAGPKSQAALTFDELVLMSGKLGEKLRHFAEAPSESSEAFDAAMKVVGGLRERTELMALDHLLPRVEGIARALDLGVVDLAEFHWAVAHQSFVEIAGRGAVLFDELDGAVPRPTASILSAFSRAAGALLGSLSSLSASGNDQEKCCATADLLLELTRSLDDSSLAAASVELHRRFVAEPAERVGTLDEWSQAVSNAQRLLAREFRLTVPPHLDVGRIVRTSVLRDSLGPKGPSRASAVFDEPAVEAASERFDRLASYPRSVFEEEKAPVTHPAMKPPAGAPEPAAPVRDAAADSRREEPDSNVRKRTPEGGEAKSRFLRVEVEKIEHLMALAGEIGLAAGGLFSLPALRNSAIEGLDARMGMLESLIRELQDTSAGLALVPVSTVFTRMNRLARDLSHQTGKKFQLSSVGGETELDKLLVDALHDPLVHLLRNSADHGLETPAQRVAAGKPECAQIVLSARQSGDSVIIRIRDDGRGMNRKAILDKALEKRLVSAEQAEAMTDSQVWDLVFAPGFSTAEQVSSISGRGIGMDVVRSTIQAHRGRVTIQSRPGQGTTVQIVVPLTLAFLDGMVVRIRDSFYILPVTMIHRVFRAESEDVVRVRSEQVDLVRVEEEFIPVVPFEALLLDERSRIQGVGETEDAPIAGRLVVVLKATRGKLALKIDELVGQEQVTMKPMLGHLAKFRAGSACGLLRSGEVAIALDCDRLRELMHDEAA